MALWRAGFRFIISSRYNKIKARTSSFFSQRLIQTESEAGEEEGVKKDGDLLTKKKTITFSCGKYANLANGCAVAEYGGSAVMATAVGLGEPKDFDVPLVVNYQQKAAAIGRIPMNFFRRDYGTTDSEILVSRMIDRSLRPLFVTGQAIETQIVCNPLSLDGVNFPEPLAVNAASAALACSDIPWNGPVACVRVALIDDEVVINPSKYELNKSSVNLIVTGLKDNLIVMLEGSCNNLSLPELQKCLKAATKNCKQIINSILDLQKQHGKVKREIQALVVPPDLRNRVRDETEEKMIKILTNYSLDKKSRDELIKNVYNSCVEVLKPEFEDTNEVMFKRAFHLNFKDLYVSLIVRNNLRCDGRATNEIRVIDGQTNLYEALHGSSTFRRGQTQVFCTVALDSPNASLRMDKITMLTSGVKEKNFFVHYEFPPYATGEIGNPRRNRREVGHGNLAENGLRPAIPDSFPFTIRLTSEVLESNGSSSMATVCGGTMALLDAGIPLRFDVAGIAMGLLLNRDKDVEEPIVLTDILGLEDYLGEMDFKIAGTKTGVTAIQLDVKVPGIQNTLLYQILGQGKKALSTVLKAMNKVISVPRVEGHINRPVMKIITIPHNLRSKFIGYGGSNIKKLELEVGVDIIELDVGKYSIFAVNNDTMNEAIEKLDSILKTEKEPELEFGGIYTATVVQVRDNGCLVTLFDNMQPAFIPLSQLDTRRGEHPSAFGIDVGSRFQIKYFGRDPVSGAMRLSRKALFNKDDLN